MVTTPEIELVVLSASELNPARTARLQELAAGNLNWESVLATGAAHTVQPLLHRALTHEVKHGVPAEIESRLRGRCQQIAIANLIAAGELDRVRRTLDRAGIRSLSFKGPTLATLAYGDLAMRQFSDLDVLVDAADFEQASQSLIAIGFRVGYDLSADQERYHVARHGVALYSGDRIDIDLHIRLLGERFRFALTFDELWKRRQIVTVAGGSECPTISNEDLCLYLSVHGAKHCWQRLSWIRDLTFLLRPNQVVNWPEVMSRARDHGCERIVLLGLSLAENLCGSTLPGDLAAKCAADPVVNRLKDRVLASLADPDQQLGTMGRIRFAYDCRGRLGEALRWVAAMTFLPHVSDWQRLKLPRPLWFLYPLVRPLRLATKYAGRSGRK